MAKPKIFVSFDYDNDRTYKYLLQAWDANKDFEFTFSDQTPGEIDSNDVGRIKAVLTSRINDATTTLVIVGKEANKTHKLSDKIGYKNWINFEVAKSKAAKNKLVAVKLSVNFESPDELLSANAKWVYSFNEKDIVAALK